jgi:hypothetical protein
MRIAMPVTTAPGLASAAAAIELEREQTHAFLERDIARLDELWSDALVVNSPMNRVLEKGKVLELLGAGVIAHHTYDVEIDAVRETDNTLVVMGSDRVTMKPDSPLLHRRFTNVWMREGGRWRMFARQASLTTEGQGRP